MPAMDNSNRGRPCMPYTVPIEIMSKAKKAHPHDMYICRYTNRNNSQLPRQAFDNSWFASQSKR